MFGVIEKSGTGIGKSGTGIGTCLAAGLLLAAAATSAQALDRPGLQISQQGEHLVVSVHAQRGVVAGAAVLQGDQADYLAVPLYSVLEIAGSGGVQRPLVQGSGSGTSSDGCDAGLLVQGSGSGASGESCGSQGAQVMVQGSGSGASGESCAPSAGLLVQGSGSGASGESEAPGASLMVQGSGSGAPGADDSENIAVRGSGSGAAGQSTGPSLMVQGSGSGSSGQSTDPVLLVQGSGSGSAGESCSGGAVLWGIAEVLIDSDGTHVIVHQASHEGLIEYMVAFDRHQDQGAVRMTNPEFIALP
jgi:hypothetical protein